MANHFGTTWVPEYGREYWETKAPQWKDQTPTWTSDEFVHIAEEQQRRENEAARGDHQFLICDTNAFATGTRHERYVGSRDERVDRIGARDRVTLYLLTDVDVPFVQDGWRDGERVRDWMHRRFVDHRIGGTVPFVILSGSWTQRRQRAVNEVNRALVRPAVTSSVVR